jgi:hypothetical protein
MTTISFAVAAFKNFSTATADVISKILLVSPSFSLADLRVEGMS